MIIIFFCLVTGIQGYRMRMDANGDAEFNLTLVDVRNNSGKFGK